MHARHTGQLKRHLVHEIGWPRLEGKLTEMSEAATCAGEDDPVSWFRLAMFQRTINGDSLWV